MKKIFGFALVGLASICLTGCGSKSGSTLTCTGTSEGENVTLKANLDGDKVTKFTMESSETYEDSTELETAYSSSKLVIGMYDSIDGASGKVSKNGKKLSATISMDLKKMDEKVAKDMFNGMFGTEDLTKSSLESYATKNGLTCK